MRAIVHHRYGGPEVLEVAQLPVPTPGPGQVQVHVHAAALNAADWRLMCASPFIARLENGWFRPKKWPVLGSDFSGTVSALGDGVTDIAIGDAVFGDAFRNGRAAFAEYVCVDRASVVGKPAKLSFAEAAAVPLAGVTAVQALRNAGVRSGEAVLIQGAGGGVGNCITQLAVSMSARVTAVCGPKSKDQIQRYGVDRIFDYTTEDFAAHNDTYDVIFAVNGYRTPFTYKNALRPGGRLIIVGGNNRQIFEGLLMTPFVFLFSGKPVSTLTIDNDQISADLQTLAEHLEMGRLTVDIDRMFPLEDTPDALRYMLGGHVRGKIVLNIG